MTGPAPVSSPCASTRLPATAAALLVALGLIASPGAPAAATVSPDPSPSTSAVPAAPDAPAAEPVGTLTAEVASEPAPTLAPGETLRVMVRIENGADLPLEDAVVELALTERPITSAAAIDRFVASPSGALDAVATSPVGIEASVPPPPGSEPDAEPTTVHRLAPGSTGLTTVTATEEELALPDDAWGVYGMTVTLVAGGERMRVGAGVVTWTASGVPELALAALATATGPGASLDVVTGTPGLHDVTVATDGTQLVGLDPGAVALSGREVLRLPSYTPDVVSLAHAGDESLLEYAVARSAGGADATDAAPWISYAAGLDVATATLLHDQGAAAVLLDTLPGDGDGDGTGVPAVDASTGLRLLSPEPVLTASVSGTDHPAVAVAKAALLSGDAVGPVLVAPGPGWLARGTDTAALEAVLSAPFVTAVGVADLLAWDEAPTADVPDEAVLSADDIPAADVLGNAHRLGRGQALAVTVEDPADVLDPLGTMLLEPLSVAWRDTPERRASVIAAADVRADRLLGALSVPAGSDINLIAARGSVPVNVRNELPVPAEVSVDVTSFSPNLQVRDTPTVTVPAESIMTVLVDVEAVSTADVNATIVLRNADGVALGDSTALSVRVRADWGNAATAVFSIGLVLLLVMGVIRTIRRGRKDTRTGPQPEEPAPASTPGDDA